MGYRFYWRRPIWCRTACRFAQSQLAFCLGGTHYSPPTPLPPITPSRTPYFLTAICLFHSPTCVFASSCAPVMATGSLSSHIPRAAFLSTSSTRVPSPVSHTILLSGACPASTSRGCVGGTYQAISLAASLGRWSSSERPSLTCVSTHHLSSSWRTPHPFWACPGCWSASTSRWTLYLITGGILV